MSCLLKFSPSSKSSSSSSANNLANNASSSSSFSLLLFELLFVFELLKMLLFLSINTVVASNKAVFDLLII
jgi:hypothetical protein